MLILYQEIYLSSLYRKFHYLIIAHSPFYNFFLLSKHLRICTIVSNNGGKNKSRRSVRQKLEALVEEVGGFSIAPSVTFLILGCINACEHLWSNVCQTERGSKFKKWPGSLMKLEEISPAC